ncbi:MAG: hypothetical protein MUC31_00845 [Bacteroidales bacterium]|nr:hypothetical protein [Bacteroidales bacterium]
MKYKKISKGYAFFGKLLFAILLNNNIVAQNSDFSYMTTNKKGQWGLKEGKHWLIEPKYDSIYYLGPTKKRIVVCRHSIFYDIIDLKSKLVLHENLGLKEINVFNKFGEYDAEVLYKDRLWGWIGCNIEVKPEFDSLRFYSGYFIGTFRNGKQGLMSFCGSCIVECGDYTNFTSKSLSQSKLEYNGSKIYNIIVATRKDGGINYFNYDGNNDEIPAFLLEEAINKENIFIQRQKDYQNWWLGLKFFRDSSNYIGILDRNNEVFVPAVLGKVTLLSNDLYYKEQFEIYPHPVKGFIKKTDGYTFEDYSDTLPVLDLYLNSSLKIYPKNSEFTDAFAMQVGWGFDYTKVDIKEELDCNSCTNGKIMTYKVSTTEKVISTEKRYTVTTKKVWGELNEKGQLPTTKQEVVIPAQKKTETMVDSKEITCPDCHGSGKLLKTIRWDEQLQEFNCQISIVPID